MVNHSLAMYITQDEFQKLQCVPESPYSALSFRAERGICCSKHLPASNDSTCPILFGPT